MNRSELPTNDYWLSEDWDEALPTDAEEKGWGGADYSGTFRAGDPTGERVEDMTAARIAEVLHWHAESPEGGSSVNFYTVVRLHDGQYAMAEAWADYTGWGCQANAWWKVGPTYESVLAELSAENRRHLTPSQAS